MEILFVFFLLVPVVEVVALHQQAVDQDPKVDLYLALDHTVVLGHVLGHTVHRLAVQVAAVILDPDHRLYHVGTAHRVFSIVAESQGKRHAPPSMRTTYICHCSYTRATQYAV